MNVKALSLIFLIVFATAATSVIACLSASQINEENVSFTESCSITLLDGGMGVEPNGDPIDTPGMPT